MNDFEKLDRLLNELKEDPRPKLVEGIKDKRALESFGIKNIFTIHGTLADTACKIKGEVILLTDFDRRGRILTKRFIELFENEGISVNLRYRAELRTLARINETEELPKKYRELRDES
jgi:5S rRNA maturation endonuclease (ribonuclease M5)